MNSAITFTVLAVALSLAGSEGAGLKPVEDEPRPQALFHVGTSTDGKAYFADRISRSWTAAGTYCRNLNMKLASIISEAQATILGQSYSSSTFAGEFWTDGRDAQSVRQFSWNSTNGEVGSQVNFTQEATNYATCLVYRSEASLASHYANKLCSSIAYPLCEN